MTAARPSERSSPAASRFVLPAREPGEAGPRPAPGTRSNKLANPPASPSDPLPLPPGRTPGTLLVDSERAARGAALLRRETLGLANLGQRLCALADCQGQLLGEAADALRAVETAARSGEPVAGLAQRVRNVAAVLEWCAAAQDELRREAAAAADGQQAIDLVGLCDDVVHDLGGAGERVRVVGAAQHAVWGRLAVFGRLVRLALELVDDRSGGLGDLLIEVEEDDAGPLLRIQGLGGAAGEGGEADLPEPRRLLVDDFRAAATEAGIAVLPNASDRHHACIVLRAPADLRGPLLPHS